jgi:hypothetical protein
MASDDRKTLLTKDDRLIEKVKLLGLDNYKGIQTHEICLAGVKQSNINSYTILSYEILLEFIKYDKGSEIVKFINGNEFKIPVKYFTKGDEKHLKLTDDQLYNIKLELVKKNGCHMSYFQSQALRDSSGSTIFATREICLLAVKMNYTTLFYVEIQDYEICKTAISTCGDAIMWLNKNKFDKENPLTSEQLFELCSIAITNKVDSIKHILNQNFCEGIPIDKIPLCKQAANKYLKSSNVIYEVISRFYSAGLTDEELDKIITAFVEVNGNVLQHVIKKTYEICLKAVSQTGDALLHITNKYTNLKFSSIGIFKLCMTSVKNSSNAVKWITCNSLDKSLTKEQLDEIYLAAVNFDGSAIKNIDEKTYELCLAAVKNGGYPIPFPTYYSYSYGYGYGHNNEPLRFRPSEDQRRQLFLIAFEHDVKAIKHFGDVRFVFTSKEFYEFALKAIQKDDSLFGSIANLKIPYKDYLDCSQLVVQICMIAVTKNGMNLEHCMIKPHNICLAAVSQNGLALQYVANQRKQYKSESLHPATYEICIAAINQNPKSFEYVTHKTPDICKYAVNKNGLLLRLVKNQTPELRLRSVKQNGLAMEFVGKERESNDIDELDSLFDHADAKNKTPYMKDPYYIGDITIKEFNEKNKDLVETREICLTAVKQNGLALKHINVQTCEICVAAIIQNPTVIELIREPDMLIQTILYLLHNKLLA